ncbi:MAG: hypothetical protein K6F87_05140 [Lachnospiraceae bacterium]|nr:hypothetical protein [Lachnospiraceae bacterium]
MSERDVRAVESMTLTGICFDDLCDAFKQFSYEDIEVIYQRTRREISGYIRRDKDYSYIL